MNGYIIPYQKHIIDTKKKRNTLILHLLFFPFAWLFNFIPYVAASPFSFLPDFTPELQTLLNICVLIISLSTGFTSVAFYSEKRLTNKVAEASIASAKEMAHLREKIEKLEEHLCTTMEKGISASEKQSDIKINDVTKRVDRIEYRIDGFTGWTDKE